jgi:hypothetical protein
MTNEHYLIVSYFSVAFVSVCLGVVVHRLLRAPFAAIAEAVAGRLRATALKRTLSVALTMAAVLGFVSVNYKGCGKNYDEVVKDRGYLVQMNQEQLNSTVDWIVYAVFGWGVVVVICLATARRKEPERDERN